MMKRLTKRSHDTTKENGVCCTHFHSPECFMVEGNCSAGCKWEEAAWSRLADYEDTRLTPERCAEFARADAEGRYIVMRDAEQEGVARLRELAEADKDGRLVVLPCKVGDTIYHISKVRTSHFEDDKIIIDDEGRWKIYEMPFTLIHLPYIGKSYFLTREEAGKALEAMKDA